MPVLRVTIFKFFFFYLQVSGCADCMFILCPWSLFFRKILVFCLHLFIVFIWTETSSCIFLYLRRDSALRKECTALQKVCVFNHFIPFHTNSMPLRWSWINKWKATEKLVDKQEKKTKKLRSEKFSSWASSLPLSYLLTFYCYFPG